MRYDAKQYAQALYEIVRGENDRAAKQSITRFVEDMTDRGLIALLPKILKELPAAAKKVEGIEDVLIEAASQLDKRTVKVILASLGKDEDQVEVMEKQDAGLIGGFRVRGADTVIDASIKGRLQQLGTILSKSTN